MITLQEISLNESKTILTTAEKENCFVKSISDEGSTVFDIVKGFKGHKDLHLFNVNTKNTTVGFISSFPYTESKNTISLGVMYILPEHRDHGYGKTMVELFLDYAKSQGFKKVFTKTWSSNTSPIKIFDSLGFMKVDTKEKDRVNGDGTMEYLKEFQD